MDAEEIARLVKDLRVSSDTNEKAVTITEEEARKGLARLENVVVGKIFARRVITREMLRANLPRILRARGGTEIEVVGFNLFVISFSLESDRRVALEEGPWHFFQDLMILKQPRAMQTPMEVDFDKISLWVQCHNVPLECMTPPIIERIGGQVGIVEEIDVGEGGTCMGKFARVRVTRSISEPLVRCVPLKLEGLDKDVIVILQYEKLPDFCFLCGRVGHISRDCRETSGDKDKPRFDSWLRAGRSFVGRRDVDLGSRDRSRQSGSGESAQRWVAIRPEVRMEEGVIEKERNRLEGSKVDSHGFDEGGTGVDMEVTSMGVPPEVSLQKPPGSAAPRVLASAPVSESGLGSLRELSSREDGGELALSGKGKGKEKGRELPSSTKGGGKKWKRLARESGAGLSEVGGEVLGSLEERRCQKRRGSFLHDEEDEKASDPKKLKATEVISGEEGFISTAEAAAQPRRSL